MKSEIKMTKDEMEELIEMFDVPTKIHLQEYGDKQDLKRYRILRTKAEDMAEDYNRQVALLNLLKNTDIDIATVRRSANYGDYYLDNETSYISLEQYELIKEWIGQ